MEQKRLLLITNSELGQGNVYLAVSHELLRLDPSLDLHFCSFAPLSKAVASLKEAVSPEGRTPQVTFHELHGPTWKEALFTRPEHRWEEICSLHPSAWNTRKAAPLMPRVCTPWTPDELVDLVQQVEKIILEVNADLVLVDNLFTPGITVCYELKPNWSILSPNTYREFILGNQPNREYLWKHPPTASLIPHPVPFYLIPSAYYQLRQYMKNAHSPWVIAHARHIRAKIQREYSDWGRVCFDPPKGLKIILPSNAAVDFPFSVVPSHIVSCGPIVRPAPPVEEVDPDLAAWLKRRPTVYVNLGTHASYDDDTAAQLAGALRVLLVEGKKKGEELQVLWKLKKQEEDKQPGFTTLLALIGPEWKDHVRIVEWLHAEPISILESGSVICSVNHGGANSYFEAVSAGVPQVVLPVWFDTYDFARRVEYFGIGKIGNYKHAPGCSKRELAPVLKRVALGKSAAGMREKAAAMAKACEVGGGGRVIAAKAILSELKET